MVHANIEPLAAGAHFDSSLRAPSKVFEALGHKRVWPHTLLPNKLVGPSARLRESAATVTRKALFAAIASGRPVLLSNVRVPVARELELGLQPALLKAISRAFRPNATAGAQVGRKGTRRELAISELLRRWEGRRHVVSITDLHVRNTTLERDIDTAELSRFNLLPLGTENMRRQEMMTLVVSSRANITDSHSDDPDGSNHCFVGRKLWLAWETFEGKRAGLQDCSRDEITERARFNLTTFASLRSAKWWTVGPGETLFLPGRFSHRVVTLEPYIGIGSFYCTPASCLENLSRWYYYGALWSLEDPDGENRGLVDEISTALTRKLRLLSRQTNRHHEQWGLDFCEMGLHHWQRRWTHTRRSDLIANHLPFAGLVKEFEKLADTRST